MQDDCNCGEKLNSLANTWLVIWDIAEETQVPCQRP